MSACLDLLNWLQNDSKPYNERVSFALKAWQSVDFANQNKYQTIIDWFAQSLEQSTNELCVDSLSNLFMLRAQPGLVCIPSKNAFIEALLKCFSTERSLTCFDGPELLHKMLHFELLQDAFRADYALLMRTYGTLFKCYELRLLHNKTATIDSSEAEFSLSLLKSLRAYVQHAQNLEKLLVSYKKHALQPLVELILQLSVKRVNLATEFAELDNLFTEEMKNLTAIEHTKELLLHVRLYTLSSLLHSRQQNTEFLKTVVKHVFKGALRESCEEDTPQVALNIATFTLKTLRAKNISLQFYMKENEESALKYIGKQLLNFVNLYKQNYLREVLILLCEALKLNPLLLEENVFQITIWMMAMPKHSFEEQQFYANYMVLLFDMFRRLSRSERFVMNLLKSLREYLSKYELKVIASKRSALKENPDEQQMPSSAKRRRVSKTAKENTEPTVSKSAESHYMALLTEQQVPTYVHHGFDSLEQTWPSHSVGAAFTKLISSLVSKPSITIWKTLLHSLAEFLEDNCQVVLPINLNFVTELHAAMLCQYFNGVRLVEQLEQNQPAIEQLRSHTAQVLQQFGRLLLRQEHNRRTMNAFLECVLSASNFDTLLSFYWPDSLEWTTSQLQRHTFLEEAEWTLIKQRVHNFGKSDCQQRMHNLEMQLNRVNCVVNLQRLEDSAELLGEQMNSKLLNHLTREEKQFHLQSKLQQLQLHKFYYTDLECIELLTVSLLEQYAAALKDVKQNKALILKLNYEQLLQNTTELALATLADLIRQQVVEVDLSYTLPQQATDHVLAAIRELPLTHISSLIKSKLWLLIFALYLDISNAQLAESADMLLEKLIDMLHFGTGLPICSYFPELSKLCKLVSPTTEPGWRFYETLFVRCIKTKTQGSEELLNKFNIELTEQLSTSNKLQSNQRRLLLLALETLSEKNSLQPKSIVRSLVNVFGIFMEHKFRSKSKKPDFYKSFVNETLSGYVIYLRNYINHISEMKPIDDDFRRVCKIYMGHTINYRNKHALLLLNLALTYREQIHFDQDEIQALLDTMWRQLLAVIQTEDLADSKNGHIARAIKIFIVYKANEDFMLLLRKLNDQVKIMQQSETQEQDRALKNVVTLLSYFAECSLSSVKAAILNENFNIISSSVELRLPSQSLHSYCMLTQRLLNAHQKLASNRTVALSGHTFDCMLASMVCIDITKYLSKGAAWQDFLDLYGAIAESCMVLLRDRSDMMSDRMGQLQILFEDLLQAVVGYRADRMQDQSLSENELDGLSNLSMKLATLMNTIVSKATVAIKRVAPFLLIFAIKQMVDTKRPTTNYEKIKINIHKICHDLIGLCDHRSSHFILRASSAAGGQMYQSLMKEHDKYHKFKGKV